MNNPMQIMQIMKNPQMLIQQAMQSANPIVRNAVEMYQKGDKDGINELMNNLCKEKGIRPEDIMSQIKSQFGM